MPQRWPHLLCLTGTLLLLAAGCSSPKVEDPATSPLYFFNRGNEAYEREDYPRAVRMYRQALALDERSPVVFYNLGLAYQMLEAYPESAQAYNRALKLDAAFAEAHMNLALVYDRLYDLEQAQSHYDQYLALMRSAANPMLKDGAAAGTGPAAAQAQPAGTPARANLPGTAIGSLPGGRMAQARAPQVIQEAPTKRAPQARPKPLADASPRAYSTQNRNQTNQAAPGRAAAAREPSSETPAQWWTQDLPARNP